jgi:hypothetical protein
MTVRDLDPQTQDKRLHQRHINTRTRVSARLFVRKLANAAECTV